MPIDLCSSMDRTSKWAFESPLLNSLLGNKLAVSILISFIMIILVMLIYPAKKGTGITLLCKMFIYMALFSGLIIFMHDGVMMSRLEEEQIQKSGLELLSNQHPMVSYSDSNIKVRPNMNDDDGQQQMPQQMPPMQQQMQQPIPSNVNKEISVSEELKQMQEQNAITGSGESKNRWWKRKPSKGLPHNPYN